jgi:DNA-binding response OmpR family regulator
MILIVEKERIVGLSLKLELEKLNKKIVLVASWEEAKEIMKTERPLCIISGDDLLRHQDKHHIIHNLLIKKNISVLFTTSGHVPETSYDLDIIDVARKPFLLEELKKKIESFLN